MGGERQYLEEKKRGKNERILVHQHDMPNDMHRRKLDRKIVAYIPSPILVQRIYRFCNSYLSTTPKCSLDNTVICT